MRSFCTPGLAVLVAVSILGSAEARPIKVASLAPDASAWGRNIKEMADEIKAATDGEVELKLFLGGKLGDESKVSKKLGRGLDGAFFTGQGMGYLLPAYRIVELPFLVETYDEADAARKVLWPLMVNEFAKNSKFVLMAPGETGMVYLFSRQPIDTVAELRRAKLWVWEGDQMALDTFKVFGVSPRPFDILTVVQQLKSGGIDTVYNSAAGAVAFGWTRDLKHVSGKTFAYATGGFVLTKKAFAKIPIARQKLVKEIAARFGEKNISQARSDNRQAIESLTAQGGGLKQVAISETRYQEFKKIAVAAWPALAKSVGGDVLLKKVRGVLEK